MNADTNMHVILAAIEDAMFLVDTDGCVLEVNQAACQSLGRSRDELLGCSMCDFASCPRESGEVAWWNDLGKSGKRRMQLLHTRKDGHIFPVEVQASALELDGKCRVLGLVRDISEFKSLEAELRKSQAFLRATLQADDDGIMVLDDRGCVQLANERLADMWRLPQKLLEAKDGQNCAELLMNDLEEPESLEQLLRENTTAQVDHELMRFKDGRIFERYASPIKDGGEIQGRIWSFRDVTEQKWTEMALRESETRYRTLYDQALDMIVVADADTGDILDCNKATERMTGRPCSELIGKHQSILHPFVDRVGDFNSTFLRHQGDNGDMVLEGQVQHVSGSVRDVSIKASRLQLNGRVIMQGIFHDITEYKRAQGDLARAKSELEERVAQRTAELANSEAKFRALVETSSDWIWELDNEARYIFVSPKVKDILGYEPEELLGRKLADLLTAPPSLAGLENVHADAHELLACMQQGRDYHNVEYAVQHKAGHTVVLESSGVTVLDEHGVLLGFRGVDRDITLRRRAEADLRQAKDRAESFNEAKSRFLSSVTHELKTPINAVLGMAELLHSAGLQGEHEEYLSHLRDAANRLLRIVNDILEYSRLDQAPRPDDSIVMGTREFFYSLQRKYQHAAWEKELSFHMDISEDVPAHLQGGWTHLQRLVELLLDNAIKFTDQGSVSVQVALAASDSCLYLASRTPGACEIALHVMIADTGPGIPVALQEQIFEAFFQVDGDLSRHKGGAGIGLAICQHAAQLLGGRLWVESEPGNGSIFHVMAPFVEDGIAEEEP